MENKEKKKLTTAEIIEKLEKLVKKANKLKKEREILGIPDKS